MPADKLITVFDWGVYQHGSLNNARLKACIDMRIMAISVRAS